MSAQLQTILQKENSVTKVLPLPSVAKSAKAKPSKLTASYWLDRVFQKKRDGEAYGFYIAAIQHAGRREFVSLAESDRDKAARKAAKVYANIRAKGWDAALAELDPDKAKAQSGATIADVVDAIMAAGLRDRTAQNYAAAVRWFAARAVGLKASRKTFGPTGSKHYREKYSTMPLEAIAHEKAQRIVDLHVELAGEDELDKRRARISAHSFLRNARAGINAAVEAGRLAKAAANPFDGVEVEGDKKAPKYRSTVDAGQLLKDAKEHLRGQHRDAYLTVLLALGAGLRRGEIQNLTWQHVNAKAGFIDVATGGSWRPKTDASENIVHVDEGLIAELETFRGRPEQKVLDNPAAGTDHAAAWLREQGITGNKPIHTLRKEFGSLIYNATDLLIASKQLRHSATAVTESFYVEPRKQYAPEIGAMLKTEK